MIRPNNATTHSNNTYPTASRNSCLSLTNLTLGNTGLFYYIAICGGHVYLIKYRPLHVRDRADVTFTH